jgi:hypothetical protein
MNIEVMFEYNLSHSNKRYNERALILLCDAMNLTSQSTGLKL